MILDHCVTCCTYTKPGVGACGTCGTPYARKRPARKSEPPPAFERVEHFETPVEVRGGSGS